MAQHRPGNRKLRLLALPLALLSAAGCGGTKVTRIDHDQTVDLSGQWNDSDSRMVSEEMIKDCLSQAWLRRNASSMESGWLRAVPVARRGWASVAAPRRSFLAIRRSSGRRGRADPVRKRAGMAPSKLPDRRENKFFNRVISVVPGVIDNEIPLAPSRLPRNHPLPGE